MPANKSMVVIYFNELEGQVFPPSNESSNPMRGPPAKDRILIAVMYINFSVICQAFDIFGVITNTINIIVFKKMGFKETVNMSLMALAVSDFGSCFTLIFQNICLTPLFHKLDLPFDPKEIHYLTAGWPHSAFTEITSIITAFIIIERCLCVTVPFKVKTIITRKRVKIFLISTYVTIIACCVPIYYSNRLDWKFYPEFNKSLIGLVFTEEREITEAVIFTVLRVMLPIAVYIFIIVCTALLIVTLKKKSKWRQTAATVTQSEEMENKERRISTMVLTVSILFIVCFSPVIALTIARMAEKEFAIDGKYRSLFGFCYSSLFIMETVNSSMNIFIYYFKSSKYQATFNQVFRIKRKTGHKPGK